MYQLLLGVYILVCFLLVTVILMQSGRGGGLVESFSAAETIFGGKTNIYMVRITMILGGLFLALALGLNYFVVQRSKSVMERLFSRPARTAPMAPVKEVEKRPEEKVSGEAEKATSSEEASYKGGEGAGQPAVNNSSSSTEPSQSSAQKEGGDAPQPVSDKVPAN